jgi:hypothetical protein
MKYKKQIATGALALSLLVGGSSVFASSPQDLGIKKVQQTYQKQSKHSKEIRIKKKNNTVGVVSSINNTGFLIDVKNIKAKTTSSIEVKTDATTIYSKNGKVATAADLVSGQKVIVVGTLDKATNILTAQKVKIVTKVAVVHKVKKVAKTK